MVTPGISGLFNPNALRALKDGGIKYVVGDNSVTALQASNPYHGIQTTAAVNGYESVYIVPRFPTDIYYDTPNPTVNAQEYNYRYKSYWGRNLVCTLNCACGSACIVGFSHVLMVLSL